LGCAIYSATVSPRDDSAADDSGAEVFDRGVQLRNGAPLALVEVHGLCAQQLLFERRQLRPCSPWQFRPARHWPIAMAKVVVGAVIAPVAAIGEVLRGPAEVASDRIPLVQVLSLRTATKAIQAAKALSAAIGDPTIPIRLFKHQRRIKSPTNPKTARETIKSGDPQTIRAVIS